MQRPAVRAAIDYVLRLIDPRTGACGSVLPGIRELARNADVSIVTMWKALHALVDEGKLRSMPGRRFRIVNAGRGDSARTSSSRKVAAATQSRYRIRAEIEKRILTGVYEPGDQLPSVKELCAALGCAYATIKHALEALVADQLLLHRARGYAVPDPAHRGATVTMVLLYDATVPRTGFTEQILRHFELECHRRGCIPAIIPFLSLPVRSSLPTVADIIAGHAGWIPDHALVTAYLCLIGLSDERHRTLVEFLRRRKKPVVVFDESSGSLDESARTLTANSLLGIYGVADAWRLGYQTAKYLMGLGHRTVAYISCYHKAPWSKARCEALARAYAAAGLPGAVEEFTLCDGAVGDDYLRLASRNRANGAMGRFADRWLRSLPQSLHGYAQEALDEFFYEQRYLGEIARRFAPFLDRAFAAKGITSWVAANDQVAIMALAYLKHRGVNVPGDMSVMGFDDNPEALRANLTTYNFNIPAIVRGMFDFALHPDKTTRSSGGAAVVIEGMIIERGTTGRARA